MKLLRYKIIFILFIISGLYTPKTAIAQSRTIVITPSNPSVNIGDKIDVLLDQGNQRNFAEISAPATQQQFQPHLKSVPTFGIIPHTAVWSRFSYDNQTNEDVYLEVQSAFLDTIRLYIYEEQQGFKVIESGDYRPFQHRPFKMPTFAFQLPKGKHLCYLYIMSPTGVNQFPLSISTNTEVFNYQHNKSIAQGIYFGFVILIIFYNLFLWISLKERLYGLYVCYIIATGLTIAQINGYTFQYFFPQYPQLNTYENVIFSLNFFAGLFAVEFLNLKQTAPKALYGIYFFYVSCGVIAVTNLLGFQAFANAMIQGVAVINAIYIISISIKIYVSGYAFARLFLYAWVGYLIGTIILIGQLTALLPLNWFTANALQIGSAFEMVLLSLAVAEKINILKKDKEKAQADFVATLQTNAELIAKQNSVLEEKVYERTQELAVMNEELRQNQEEILAQRDFIVQQHEHLKQRDERLGQSILAATHIQHAILPENSFFQQAFKDHFILYLPKDTVSGDFFAIYKVAHYQLVIAADCTGHGVPGAFMTLIGKMLLDKIIEQEGITSPAEILISLHEGINATFSQKNNGFDQGMDVAICRMEIGTDAANVTFSGAKRPMFYYVAQENVLKELGGGRHSLGGFRKKQPSFENQTVVLHPDDTIYLCSDGFIDQNDMNRENFGILRFREMLGSHATLPLSQQKETYHQRLLQYEDGTEQRDDILLLGIKLF